ncbi:MAG: FixH family protein [Thermomicrobiales bacterium]
MFMLTGKHLIGGWRRRWLAFAFLACVWSAFHPVTVSAHAQYDHSDPAANAIVAIAPIQVTIWFTEHLEPSGSSAQLFDKDGQPISGTTSSLGTEPKQLVLSLPSGLANGTYSVVWNTLSADDGHPAQGYFVFTIGSATDVQAVTAPAAPAAHGAPQWLRASARWAALLGLAAAVAVWPVWLLIVRSSYTSTWKSSLQFVHAARRYAAIALLVAFAGDLYALLVQAADLPSLAYFDRLHTVLTDTRFGRLWLLRLGLLVAYAVALFIADWWWPRQKPLRAAVAFALALALPLPFSLNAHASAETTGRTVAIASDCIHLLAASLWIGGLFLLCAQFLPFYRFLSPAGRRAAFTRMLPRFSILALTSWGMLGVTGLYASWLQVGNLEGLLHTAYGHALIIKLLVLLPLLALGAFNLLVVTPRLRTARDSDQAMLWSRHFRRAVGTEVVLVVLLLLAVGRLTSLQPARDELATTSTALALKLSADGRTGRLTVTPGAAGPNHYRFELDGESLLNGTEALLRLTLTSQNIGEKEVTLIRATGNAFEGHGSEFGIAGDWKVDMIVRKIGAFQWQASTQTTIAGQATKPEPVRAAWHFGPVGLLGLLLLLLGVFGVVFACVAGRTRLRFEVGGLAACSLLAGALLLVQARTAPTADASAQAQAQTSLSTADQAAITRGKAIYDMNCASCHGATGRGDGPGAAGLNPAPVDFTSPLHKAHQQQDLLFWVKEGIGGSAMPAFGDQLTDEQISDVLAYVRELGNTQTQQVDIPDPAECTIAPANVPALIANVTPSAIQPTPPPPVGPDFVWPRGDPATQAQTDGVTKTIRQFVACASAQDFSRRTALYSDHYLRPFLASMDDQAKQGILAAAAAPANPMPEGQRGWIQEISDMRALPDGRVGARVIIDDPVNHPHVTYAVLVFAQSGDQWLIDEIHADPGTASPAATPAPLATPDAAITTPVTKSAETVQIEPFTAKLDDNQITADITDAKGQPVTGAIVSIAVDPAGSPVGSFVVPATESTPGKYTATVPFAAAGNWRLTVRLGVPGKPAVPYVFTFTVPDQNP